MHYSADWVRPYYYQLCNALSSNTLHTVQIAFYEQLCDDATLDDSDHDFPIKGWVLTSCPMFDFWCTFVA